MLTNFAKHLKLNYDPGSHAVPYQSDGVDIVKTLMDVDAFSIYERRHHSSFPNVPRQPYSGIIDNIGTHLTYCTWLQSNRSELAEEVEYNKFKKHAATYAMCVNVFIVLLTFMIGWDILYCTHSTQKQDYPHHIQCWHWQEHRHLD